MPVWRERHPGVEELRVAVMGCVVNGPGESKHADIGISLPGTFEEPVAPVFIDGALDRTLRGDHIVDEFKAILDGTWSGGSLRGTSRAEAKSAPGCQKSHPQKHRAETRVQHDAPGLVPQLAALEIAPEPSQCCPTESPWRGPG